MLELKATRSNIVVGSTLALVGVCFLYLVVRLWLVRGDFVQEIDAIKPRTARLLGMVESQQALEKASLTAQSVLRDIAYESGRDSAMMAAAMQQDVREIMTDAGLSVAGSQILAARRGEGFDRLSLDITAEGNVESLDQALANLEGMRPLVIIESVKIKPVRSRSRSRAKAPEVSEGDPRKVSARFQLFSLRLHE